MSNAQPKYIDRKRAATEYHRDYVAVNVAKGLEISQRARGELLSPREYEELEAVSLLAVYMVHLAVTGLMENEEAQKRLMDRARKLAQKRLGTELEVEATD